MGRLIASNHKTPVSVIPADAYMDVGDRATQDAKAEAGIQGNNHSCGNWIPASAGMTVVFLFLSPYSLVLSTQHSALSTSMCSTINCALRLPLNSLTSSR